MLPSTQTEQREQENSNESAQESNNSNSSNKIIEREQFPDSPFMITKIDDKGWIISLGNKRLTDYLELKEHCQILLEKPTWEFLITVMISVIDDIQNNQRIKQALEKVKETKF